MAERVVRLVCGSTHATEKAVTEQIQSVLCPQGPDKCAVCERIATRQDYRVVWFAPEKQQYALADLELFFDALSYQRSEDDRVCMVITAADRLSLVCANSLLKALEEPVAGVHIYLTAESVDDVLPTIVSRCIVLEIKRDGTEKDEMGFLQIFRDIERATLDQFSAYADQIPSERDTKKVLDALMDLFRERLYAGDRRAYKVLEYYASLYDKLPMPGSAKLFWRSVFLRAQQLMREI